jgi:uncharacterized protein
LEEFEIATALEAAADKAGALLAAGLIDAAALQLQGEMRVVALKGFDASMPYGARPQEIRRAIHA